METKKREIRIIPSGVSVREAAPDTQSSGRTIEGYAIRFNEESVVLDEWGERFTEIIAPSCVTEEYLKECDIKMTLFHNRESLIARNNKGVGSMRLEVDENGVKFEFEAPNTADGDKALEGVKRGDISGCSFTFLPGDFDVEERGRAGLVIRHTRFDWLGEMTLGSDPAYPTTSVNCRELIQHEEPAEEIEEPEQREVEVMEYAEPDNKQRTREIEARKRELDILEQFTLYDITTE